MRKIQRAFDGLGASQADALKVTEAITQTFKISGASASSSAAAITQLAQGLGSGALRGDELNSVLEQSPRLARALAEGMGITTGELRAAGEAGEITGEKIRKALLGQADQIAAEFSKVPLTMSDALTQLNNGATVAFGKMLGDGNAALAGIVSSAAEILPNIPAVANIVATEIVGFLIAVQHG
ncbi:tape measure protein [bacterium]|nr:tape measure protein [bacterium]